MCLCFVLPVCTRACSLQFALCHADGGRCSGVGSPSRAERGGRSHQEEDCVGEGGRVKSEDEGKDVG